MSGGGRVERNGERKREREKEREGERERERKIIMAVIVLSVVPGRPASQRAGAAAEKSQH